MDQNRQNGEINTNEQPDYSFRFMLSPALIAVVAGLIGLVTLITSQQPGRGGPTVVMVFLLCCFLLLSGVMAVVIQSGLRLLRHQNFPAVRLFYLSSLLAAGGVFLVGLQTLGQLGVIDVVLVLLFETIMSFYLIRRF